MNLGSRQVNPPKRIKIQNDIHQNYGRNQIYPGYQLIFFHLSLPLRIITVKIKKIAIHDK
ncbi:hypothetical protein A3K55_01790 [Candidatus Shapirobacteria bacterium RBG_13_44_7]|uniref:Uncharacterized protein n=1 Tax=Candidatus Shapirobacteria bacterium RBG_13_44_7 TaxID=1802149 RepID=A0A1F7SG18_9BACT|nr:MAG: hypothetical protein A3K55_01790 [Candidatus Shapirobacteria bacterium RBG_13_44_7]